MELKVTFDEEGRLERVPLEELERFQGNLKSLSEENYNRCRDSLQQHGFAFPVFYWTDKKGKKQIIDGHQRLFVIRGENWDVEGGVPVIDIKAANKKEAAQKLLALNSTYGHIEREGLYEFFHMMDLDAEVEIPKYDLPGIYAESFIEEYYNETGEGSGEGAGKDDENTIEITCPNCQHVFEAGLTEAKK